MNSTGSEQIHPLGWTNFTNCYRPEILKIIQQLGNKNERSVRTSKKEFHESKIISSKNTFFVSRFR